MTTTRKPTPQAGEAQQKTQTEADVNSVDGRSGEDAQSSHDAKSHIKAGKDTGAGGGKKQERRH